MNPAPFRAMMRYYGIGEFALLTAAVEEKNLNYRWILRGNAAALSTIENQIERGVRGEIENGRFPPRSE
jgi:hypothetical protein